MSASEARPSVPRPKKGLLLAYKITRTCLASVHKYLRFCDLCKELAFGTPESLRPNQDFIQLVRAQHVLPPVPGELNPFLCQKEATGARRSAGPPSLQTAPAPAGGARTVFSPPPPSARSSVLRSSPGHVLFIASLLLCGCFAAANRLRATGTARRSRKTCYRRRSTRSRPRPPAVPGDRTSLPGARGA